MDLAQYRAEHNLSWSQLADLIGVSQAKQARAYALGEAWPKAERLDVILRATGGHVTLADMHARRLQFVREAADPAGSDRAAATPVHPEPGRAA